MNTLYTDGGARGNPGPAAIGGVLYQNEVELTRFGEYLGTATNNEAEYEALIKGIKLAAANNVPDLVCYLDSELVVKQLNKIYKVKTPHIHLLYSQVLNLLGSFSSIKFEHIKREKNKEADKIVNEVLDAQQ